MFHGKVRQEFEREWIEYERMQGRVGGICSHIRIFEYENLIKQYETTKEEHSKRWGETNPYRVTLFQYYKTFYKK